MLAIAKGMTIVGRKPIDVIKKSAYVGICVIRLIKDVNMLMTNPITAVIASSMEVKTSII